MKLDSRIKKDKRPLTCFDTQIAKQFIGKKGYFSHYIDNYADLKLNTVLGILGSTGDTFHESFCCTEETLDNYYYEFFIPEEWVKPEESEKKYRPYKNVQELFEDIGVYIGDTIHFRSKAKETESHALITSYTTLKDGAEKICFGGAYYYTMQALFDLFELRSRGKWQPFGIKE